jgi:hypothetical protein
VALCALADTFVFERRQREPIQKHRNVLEHFWQWSLRTDSHLLCFPRPHDLEIHEKAISWHYERQGLDIAASKSAAASTSSLHEHPLVVS